MNALERHINEMKVCKKAMMKTQSIYLKNDYAKKFHRMNKELKEYCFYRGYDYKEILKKFNL